MATLTALTVDSRPDWGEVSQKGLLRALLMALLVHGVLIAALTWGVGWRRHTETPPVQAELWSPTWTQAAPMAPIAPIEPEVAPPSPTVPLPEKPTPPQPTPLPTAAPAPAPVKPQIVTEKTPITKPDKKPPEPAPSKVKPELKKDTTAQDRQKAKAAEQAKKEEAQLEAVRAVIAAEKTRAEAMQRIKAQSGGSVEKGTGKDAQNAAPSQGFLGRISARVKPNVTYLGDKTANIEAEFEMVVNNEGLIVSVRLKKSSGVPAWDDAAHRALVKTERIPLDNGRVYSPLLMVMRPRDY